MKCGDILSYLYGIWIREVMVKSPKPIEKERMCRLGW